MSCVIKLSDGTEKTFPESPTGLEVAKNISPRLAKVAVGFLVKGDSEIKDIRSKLSHGEQIDIITIPSKKSLEVIRHSAAHVMAQAVQNLWPDVKVTIGPVIENGFYYDFDTNRNFTFNDLTAIEKEMKSLLKKKHEMTKEIWSQKKAISEFRKKKESLKQEIIDDLNVPEVSIYKQGDWLDLCKGPHVQHFGQIGAIKVLNQSGAYWRGDSKNKQLQRIYGTAFHSQKDLDTFLKKQEEAKKNDHRVLGKNLDLFWFNPEAAGSPFFTPKGTLVYNNLTQFLREKYKKYGYEEVISPQIFTKNVFDCSGHTKHFKENMFKLVSKESLHSFLKPMNCPGHCLLYKKDKRSYKDLPWRIADFGRLHRKELKGALQGLTRVVSFCQDDAHIFCRLSQLSEEIETAIKMLQEVYGILGLDNYHIELSTRPENSMGDPKIWEKAEESLKKALKDLKIPYEVNEGEGAFYGPKLDVIVKDVFDRSWQLGTFQCDFNLPEAFDLNYVNEQDKEERPVMIHRAILGSLERFIGVYLEHRKGRLPLWLCPTQVLILPLSDSEKSFSQEIKKTLEQAKIICKIDDRNEQLSYKIRQAQLSQIPYMIIIGKEETKKQVLSLRLREGKVLNSLPLDKVKNIITKEIQSFCTYSLFLEKS